MKRQYYYIFCQENEIRFKLINAYMNRLCINEDDQSEVIEIHQWEEFFEGVTRNEALLQRISPSKRRYELESYAIHNVIEIILQNEIPKPAAPEYQIHFIFELAWTYELVGDMVPFQSCGLPADSPPDYNVTLLKVHQENILPVNLDSHIHTFTIGDDIELLADQLNSSNSMFYHRSHSSSVFQNFDESFYSITCKRKSYDFESELKLMQTKYINIYSFIFVWLL